MSVRDDVALVTVAVVVEPVARSRRARHRVVDEQPVDESRVDGRALAVALRLAGGDRSRLSFEADGSIVILNEARPARRPLTRGASS